MPSDRRITVWWCPRCDMQSERMYHFCERGPALIPQKDVETACDQLTVVAVDALLSDEAIDRALRASIRLDRLGDTMEVEIAVQDPRNRDSMRRALRAAIDAALPGEDVR